MTKEQTGIEVKDYLSFQENIKKFGINLPDTITLLPDNLGTAKSISDLRQQAESDTVRTLLKSNNIEYSEIFEDNNQPAYLQQYAYEWFGPTIFISASIISQNPNLISITLGLITNYLHDLFKGSENGKASLNIVLEKSDGSFKHINYNGPSNGLEKINEIVKTLTASDI